MRLKKLCVILSSALLVCLMAFSLTACGDKTNKDKYFDTETTFHWDVAYGDSATSVLGLISAGSYTFKTDGTFSWTRTSVNDAYCTALGVAPFTGTYKLTDNDTKITITHHDASFGPFEITNATNGGKVFSQKLLDVFPHLSANVDANSDANYTCIYYSNTSNLTPIPSFAYPTAVLGEIDAFEDTTNFVLDLATKCGTLNSVTASSITFVDNGSYSMTITTDASSNTTRGAYKLVRDDDEITGVEILTGSQVIMDIPFFTGLTESDIISFSITEETDYMTLTYALPDSVYSSIFYSNANKIPTFTYPEELEQTGYFIVEDRMITFNSAVGKIIAYANGKYDLIPIPQLSAFADSGAYAISATETSGLFKLHLLSDKPSSTVLEYDLELTNGGYVFEINFGTGPISFTEVKDSVNYPAELGTLDPFANEITFVEAESATPMTITFKPDGTLTGTHPAAGEFTGFYNLKDSKASIIFITTALGGSFDPAEPLVLTKNGSNKYTFTWIGALLVEQ